jgi:hypothetical protein
MAAKPIKKALVKKASTKLVPKPSNRSGPGGKLSSPASKNPSIDKQFNAHKKAVIQSTLKFEELEKQSNALGPLDTLGLFTQSQRDAQRKDIKRFADFRISEEKLHKADARFEKLGYARQYSKKQR